nr:MAG TPA: hypothetical protein [Bacteriophage sp.]
MIYIRLIPITIDIITSTSWASNVGYSIFPLVTCC